MESTQLEILIANRLEDMAQQVERLYQQGMYEEATVLRNEGLEMAEAWDSEQEFMFIEDLKLSR